MPRLAGQIVKVQLNIPQVLSGGRAAGVFAHNFVVVLGAGGLFLEEYDGLAYDNERPDALGGVLPFDHLRGRTSKAPYFYNARLPQVVLFRGDQNVIAQKQRAAKAFEALVNSRNIPYPWLAVTGPNSNSYCSTLLRVMQLPDLPVPHGWPSPQSGRYILTDQEIASLSARFLASGMAGPVV